MLRSQPALPLDSDPVRVLYLDDEEPNLFSFKAAFRRDFEIFTATEPHEAVRILDTEDIHVVLSDQRMPGISGVEFFELIMPDHPDCTRVLVTGYADTNAVVDAINKGQVYRFVSKPWNEEELRNVVTSAFRQHKSRISTNQSAATLMNALRSVDRELLDLIDRLGKTSISGDSIDIPALIEEIGSVQQRLINSTAFRTGSSSENEPF
jgi:response regulator RpfG family c-di-GMP phosphodiesterase